MKPLFIEATKSTPKIEYNPELRIVKINGQSFPENAYKFYEPIFVWLDELLKELNDELIVDFNLLYFNTSSSKCLINLIDNLEDAYNNNKKITINWHYDIDNDSARECGEEFKEDVKLPFNILPIETES